MSSAHDDPQAPADRLTPATPTAAAPPDAAAAHPAAPADSEAAARPLAGGADGAGFDSGTPQPVAGGPGPQAPPVWAAEAPYAPAGSGDGAPVDGAAKRSSRVKLGIVAAVSAVIVIGGGVAVAQAASDSSSAPRAGGPGGGPAFPGGRGGGPGAQNGQQQGGGPNVPGGQGAQGGPGGFGPGFGRGGAVLGGALHGDFVVKGGDGQYVTERLQAGTVTAVSAASITATSDDGHATTFAVNGSTRVAGGATIADVKSGDAVTIVGTVSGGTATATEITDIALMRQGNGGNGQQRPASPRPARTA
ncbi:hypothetical protein Dvina_28095 [Dactylosporangium vinaceum]|uniref:DUF5666 domain-containing protein n=1 Tax=Dactylosporangium vinaceum TaxID=53362 RepID=A0ABV5MMS8_9ACTN|nr:hypothetical protein [Dactylosporangium vinaceum]UAB92239.1 hypothetical protein Dvina_28095 [Dactylosporangium vinaceum]